MTVKELKEYIEDLPDDMEIFRHTCGVCIPEHEGNIWLYPVQELDILMTKYVGLHPDGDMCTAQRPHSETRHCKMALLI